MSTSNLPTVSQPALSLTEQGRSDVLGRFQLEGFQKLPLEDLLLAQKILGNGDTWGIWITPVTLHSGRISNSLRTINVGKRLNHFLAKEPLNGVSADLVSRLVQEGVLVLTRLILLICLIPTAGQKTSRTNRLKPSTVVRRLYAHLPQIFARAIYRKAALTDEQTLLSCLTEEDVSHLGKDRFLRTELERLGTLAARGLWTDLPPTPEIARTTDPSGPKPQPVAQEVFGQHQPIHDRYLEQFGPRNLWLIREMGPHLLPLLEDLATYLEGLDWVKLKKFGLIGSSGLIAKYIARHLNEHPWTDQLGMPLMPHFPLRTGRVSKDRFEWPPCNYEQLKVCSSILQSAHLFLTLLATGGRIGEVLTLKRSCIAFERDGKDYVRGWTYKLSENLFGDARQWPAPIALVEALGQQARLASVLNRLPPGNVRDGFDSVQSESNLLWLSIGGASVCSASEPLMNAGAALRTLAKRIGMDPRPAEKNLHPHRLRKTIARIAGVALFNSPLVLKRLFGHKRIEMTLHYILCDKDIKTEAEAILRELRILHCAEALEEVREALASGAPLPTYAGAGASRLIDAVQEHDSRLRRSGRVWSAGTAYDLAYVLTSNGQGWRFVQKNVICAKAPGERGLCRTNKGEPNTSKCKPACDSRIVLALERRDADEVLDSYVHVASQALAEEQYEVFYYSMKQFFEQLDSFPEFKEKYMAAAQMQSLLAAYQELDQ